MEIGKIVKTFKSKKGHNVVIRYPKWEDLDNYLAFVNELIVEDTFLLISGAPKTLKEEKKYLKETIDQIQKGEKLQLLVTVDGKYAGNCELRRQPYRKKHVGELGIAIAPRYRNEGIGSQLLSSLLSEGKKMGLRLVTLSCFEINTAALNLYERFGFQRAGVVPASYLYKDQYIGEIRMYLPLT